MKKIREFVRDFADNYPWLTAIVTICLVIYLLQVSGFVAWHQHFVDSFWANKRF